MFATRYPLLFGRVLLASMALAAAPAAARPAPVFRVQFPNEIAPEQATLILGEFGEGLAVGPRALEKSKYDYSFRLWEKASSFKVLLYCPGYKVLTAEFKVKDITPTVSFKPHFERLPTTPLCVRMVDSRGKPLANERFSLYHDLAPHQYFGYGDGMTYGATIASGVTKADGTCILPLPSLLDDPYFAKHAAPVATGLRVQTKRNQRDADQDLSPTIIPVRKEYREPIVITVTTRAHLHGRVAISYIRARRLSGAVTPYVYERTMVGHHRVELRAEVSGGGRSYSCMLLHDGSFSVKLPPGIYDLALVELGEGGKVERVIERTERSSWSEYYRERVPLGIRVVLNEGDDKAVSVK